MSAGQGARARAKPKSGEDKFMTKIFTSLLVGGHFRPPAKQVLSILSSGVELDLEPEPENPYDAGAIRVMLRPALIPESQESALDEALQGTGCDAQDMLHGPPLHLGYVAKTGGKPLVGTDFQGNVEIGEAMADASHRARLGFSGDGKPLVVVTIGEDEDGEC